MNVSVSELRDAMTLKPAAKGGDEASAPAAPKKAAAKKAAAPAKKPAAQTTLSPQAAWPFPTGSKP